MKTLRLAILSIAIIGLFGMISSSQASITSLSASATDDWGYGGSVDASLTANKDIYVIDWYIDNVKIKTTDHYQSPTRSVSVYLDTRTGGIQGVKYWVKAVAWFSDKENNTFVSDTATDDVRVFAPKTISGTKYPRGMPEHQRGTGIYGSVQLSRHYHDGQNIVVSGSVYASNGTTEKLNAASWYRHTRFKIDDGTTLWSVEDPRPSDPLPSGETYSNSGSSMITYSLGRNIREDEQIKLNAHVHLVVGGVVWHEENNAWTHTFDHTHNEDYEGD